MIRKLIISAAVLAALIYGKEASAAGPGGFARSLASTFGAQTQVAELAPQQSDDFIFEEDDQVVEISGPAANAVIEDVDAYMGLFVVPAGKIDVQQDSFPI